MIEREKYTQLPAESENMMFLPLLPLKNVVILPKSINPIIVGRASSVSAVEYALKHNKHLFITAQKNPDVENPMQEDVFEYGTRSKILQIMRMPKGALKILVEGMSRARIIATNWEENFLGAHYEDLDSLTVALDVDAQGLEIEIEALWRHIKSLYNKYAQLNEKAPAELLAAAQSPEDIDGLADMLAAHINLSFNERQNILETVDLKKRLEKVIQLLNKEIAILETQERISSNVQTQVEKNQREYYLREQIKAIQKELGPEDQSADIAQIRTKIKQLKLSAEAKEKVEKELKRLETMPPLSSEAVVSRHYIDWILSLPWNKISRDNISLHDAEEILNKSHAGLEKPKERIIEFLAAKKFSKNLNRSPIICLVGPPGVGKTSLGHSIAQSLGREFVRISLGGIRDEAEIRGHRRTYIGALPGKIVQAMKKANYTNPVLLLDEIDKMSSDVHGDPAAALLEVLDPEQNKSFVDHFLEVEYDLSKVMFIATANHFDGIPYALYDRMEIIALSGYTEDEKAEIARSFLIPKNLKELGLSDQQFCLPDDMLKTVISDYTKEAGVRQLERVITKLMRKTIQILLKDKATQAVTITANHIKSWLGHPKYKKTSRNNDGSFSGIATGLAWTEVGGDVLEVEVAVLPGKGGLTLTGQLGDVMQESAQAALSYIRKRAPELGIAKTFYSSKDIHIHLPEGATPKDGPSAGITMCTALISALTDNPVRKDVAMTGEITLQGRVLAVGGLKEKILAARQHDIKTVLAPQENVDEIEELPAKITQGIDIVYVRSMDEVLVRALTRNPFKSARVKPAPATRKTRQETAKKL